MMMEQSSDVNDVTQTVTDVSTAQARIIFVTSHDSEDWPTDGQVTYAIKDETLQLTDIKL